MSNKVYYGEYSLKHWINLILSGNITLPDYQRSFVWEQEQTERLIQAFEKDLFVPPITIGAYEKDGEKQNLVLDGQQRLTSILLAYLGIFPNKEKFGKNNSNNDSENETSNDMLWTFKEILKKGNNVTEIKRYFNNLDNSNNEYKKLKYQVTDNFLEEHYLGFSFLIPNLDIQKIYYASVFRAINTEGKSLSNQENREALYYLDESLKNFFSPDFISSYTIKTNDGIQKIDFVRYISIISDYRKNGINHIVKGTRGNLEKFEKYYEIYISSVITDDDSTLFGKFSNDFPKKKYDTPLNSLKEYLPMICTDNRPPFESIIMVDLLMFGLVENVLFERKKLNIGKFDELRKEISKSYREFKEITGHSDNPNRQKYIKERLQKSLDIYQEFIDESA